MTASKALLRAKNVGVRNFRNGVSRFVREHAFLVITEHGRPESVLMPYNDMLEIVDVLEELEDRQALKTIAAGRKAIRRGAKGIPFRA
jgi:PHD/YefM family antitoxin component YafN of YafNO toxin-antitoxin module